MAIAHSGAVKALIRVFSFLHAVLAVLFACVALLLLGIAAHLGLEALANGLDRAAALGVIETMGVLAAAVVALQIAQTIAEEEVIRDVHISGPTRMRRFLSRFLVVVVVALSIEGLVSAFRAVHEDAAQLVYAAALVLSVGGLLAGWAVFVRMNRYAEDIEPEALEAAKSEDHKVR